MLPDIVSYRYQIIIDYDARFQRLGFKAETRIWSLIRNETINSQIVNSKILVDEKEVQQYFALYPEILSQWQTYYKQSHSDRSSYYEQKEKGS